MFILCLSCPLLIRRMMPRKPGRTSKHPPDDAAQTGAELRDRLLRHSSGRMEYGACLGKCRAVPVFPEIAMFSSIPLPLQIPTHAHLPRAHPVLSYPSAFTGVCADRLRRDSPVRRYPSASTGTSACPFTQELPRPPLSLCPGSRMDGKSPAAKRRGANGINQL